ncbi:MAG: ABC-ATPase domain-containing protein [Candidatus Euphemobacter frigidus]|nr:ABC-ATPase domain-containing protein [Candidatus Euphemobacter frigidus]MDP8275970.1 ABC-ATPase domain-containing protein [Candidatus Euphemobacter frigidus]
MKTAKELRPELLRIDRKPYGFYKEIKGRYDFGTYVLNLDYIQPDPFAPPSQVAVRVSGKTAGFPPALLDSLTRRVALEDCLTRYFYQQAQKVGRGKRGTGHSGLLAIDKPSQEVLMRTAMVVRDEWVEARFVIGLPAWGRRISGREASEIFFEEIPELVQRTLIYSNLDGDLLEKYVDLAEDAEFIRARLSEKGLMAFVGNGSILPRVSGVDDRPLPSDAAIPFQSPPELEVEFDCPHRGPVRGMGIPEGVTLIVGGGYHGKSTLLSALEKGAYNHIPGDGRELVVTVDDSVKIRAEDGRFIENVDISPFIRNLPLGLDTRVFSSPDASGSTSQAANIMEALEVGATLLLVDEDTSATNFMIRDERMQSLVTKEKEPITPFIDKVKQLYADLGVSTILVMGGSGDYFDVADTVIMMDEYLPRDRTAEARSIAQSYSTRRTFEGGETFGRVKDRRPIPASFDPRKGKKNQARISAKSINSIAFGKHYIDLSQVEQLVDISQTRAIGDIIHYAAKNYMNGERTLREILDLVEADLDRDGMDVICPYLKGNYARPRRYEIAAAINRLRTLKCKD